LTTVRPTAPPLRREHQAAEHLCGGEAQRRIRAYQNEEHRLQPNEGASQHPEHEQGQCSHARLGHADRFHPLRDFAGA
jgi:hypothetical protein